MHESKLYAPLLQKKQRCLIPCSYYFEHHHFEQWGKKEQLLKGKLTVPFLVKRSRQSLFAVPALYSHWHDKASGKTLLTYSMFTIVANDLMAEVHNGGDNSYRMPLVIEREMEEAWLHPHTPEKEISDILNYQIHSKELSVHAVAPLTGKEARTGEAITEEEGWNRKKGIEEIKQAGKSENQFSEKTIFEFKNEFTFYWSWCRKSLSDVQCLLLIDFGDKFLYWITKG